MLERGEEALKVCVWEAVGYDAERCQARLEVFGAGLHVHGNTLRVNRWFSVRTRALELIDCYLFLYTRIARILCCLTTFVQTILRRDWHC